jgi:hypothetical protein
MLDHKKININRIQLHWVLQNISQLENLTFLYMTLEFEQNV